MRESSPPAAAAPAPAAAAAVKEDEWEVRPGGMLVQKRSPDADAPAGAPVPTIRVKVKFNGVHHEIYINSQASFGELKKMLSAKTGLHPEDQKLVYKDKERDSKAFLDMAGVRDRSKMVLLEDPAAQAKRLLEQRRTDKAERAAKSISRISLDVDKLATKVSALETIVGKGGKVVDADVVTLTEALMNELVKLDSIAADGEVKVQRRMQEKRVQKYVETLDAIRAKNTAGPPRANGNGAANANGHAKARAPHLPPRPPPVSQRRNFQQQPAPAAAAAAPPTQSWETFDLLSSVPSTSSAGVTTTMAAATTTSPAAATASPIPRFDWELF
ncbi:BAG family molecular chaperone regulator 1-like [Panicum miliaceum]|uniref:BAG family molecular chaperone regulator 1-like n=1 Tax=Panicum miliaceum TaxID=4540 RepID=A0A3L6QL99_PANMI|nr:BAG family molecular chaperone regulator 1-like [Panicum miliaceum]